MSVRVRIAAWLGLMLLISACASAPQAPPVGPPVVVVPPTPPPLAPPPPAMTALRRDGRGLVNGAGPYVWRMATGFALVDLVADGHEPAAVLFLDGLRADGFTGVRVVSTLCCWFRLTSAEGLAALPRTLALARARGMYVEVVALAATRTASSGGKDWTEAEIRAHVRQVGAVCGQAVNCLIELANENYHASQRSNLLTNVTFLKSLRASIPPHVLVSFGAGPSDEKDNYPGGDYVTVHSGRGRSTWDDVRHAREQETISVRCRCFVVDNEPLGAGEDNTGSRSTNPHEFFARGALSRLLGTGSTFHFQNGLRAIPPAGHQFDAARAYIAGTRVVPDETRLAFRNAGWTGVLESPVKSFSGAVRVYSGISPQMNLAMALGVTPAFRMTLRAGWHADTAVDRPGVQVFRLLR